MRAKVEFGGVLTKHCTITGQSTEIVSESEEFPEDQEPGKVESRKKDDGITVKNIAIRQNLEMEIFIEPGEEAVFEKLMRDFLMSECPENSYSRSKWEAWEPKFSYSPTDAKEGDCDWKFIETHTNISPMVLLQGIAEIQTEVQKNRGVGQKLKNFLEEMKEKIQPLSEKIKQATQLASEKLATSKLAGFLEKIPQLGDHIKSVKKAVEDREKASRVIKKHLRKKEDDRTQRQKEHKNGSHERLRQETKQMQAQNRQRLEALKAADPETALKRVQQEIKATEKKKEQLRAQIREKEDFCQQANALVQKLENAIYKDRGDKNHDQCIRM